MDERRMEGAVREFLEAIGDRDTASERDRTPERVASTWCRELLNGYDRDPASILRPFAAPPDCDSVLVKDIDFVSVCVHHLLPFYGKAHVAYRPGPHLVGVSKVAALVDCFSRRLQIQERLNQQIVACLMESLEAQGAACILEAKHLCMVIRGVRKRRSRVITSSFSGCFEEEDRRKEIFRLLST